MYLLSRDARIKADELGSKPVAYVIKKKRGTKDSALIIRIASPNRKRDRDKYISDNSSDNPNSPDDTDYVGESSKDVYRNSVPFYRLKRNTKRLSVDEVVQSKVAADQTSPISLYDIETIPIRGFLTR
ncbi:hypothetical protein N7516_009934 [Penicillium verrucosum]|uniref:uncharacterized protein n=1 Tax=Penicillium verrucosum TaxID=60171 RepID=UPI002544E6DF|nr:uncharacterized protein N7516_009934 [Penicillium verrucosum]KAJ5922231.1 hypothetical protein N7516_009934 [Penicillium verrucosum]